MHIRKLLSSSCLLYLLLGGFIAGWWTLAFRPTPQPVLASSPHSQSLSLKTASLLEELSPLQREFLQQALAGHFPLMLEFIDHWDQDAQFLTTKGVADIQRLPSETLLQAHILGRLLQDSSPDTLRHLNCKMNLDQIQDDSGRLLHIEDYFQHFLPQTYVSASFLLAIAPPQEIIALHRGLRYLPQLYSPTLLARIPTDISRLSSEKLYTAHPHVAFVAPYSHPPALEALRNQGIQLCSLQHVDTIPEIQQALLKVGHASNHILEAQLLAIFMEACLLSIDNRLHVLNAYPPHSPQHVLYLYHHQHYMLPTAKCLTGQLMARAIQHCPHLSCSIPESPYEWRIPFTQEKILQTNPDCLVISTPDEIHSKQDFTKHYALHQLKAYQENRIFYVDEAVQESPSQYIVLAYFDLFQALSAAHYL
jgi:iron complex transport system substrate-binding protein